MNARFPYTPLIADAIVIKDIPKDNLKILDFGCASGIFTKKLTKISKHVYGCDTDKKAIELARKSVKDATFKLVDTSGKTPYKDNYFDCIVLMGVLEHVADERQTLKEIHRILAPSGSVYIYGLHKGLLGFLDAANLKFLLPGVHRWFYIRIHGKPAYEEEFVTKENSGMFGDFTSSKRWHTHYSQADLERLAKKLFKMDRIWLYSLFIPILFVLEFLYVRYFGKRNNILSRLILLDSSIKAGQYSYSFVAKLKKLEK
jgi:ubiquinone/menaquinone biosynthesis C-methylase UbiE